MVEDIKINGNVEQKVENNSNVKRIRVWSGSLLIGEYFGKLVKRNDNYIIIKTTKGKYINVYNASVIEDDIPDDYRIS